jgi:hypothetical protein
VSDQKVEDNTTRTTARLPGLDIEIIHAIGASYVLRAINDIWERKIMLSGKSLHVLE